MDKQHRPKEGKEVTDGLYPDMLQRQEPEPYSAGKEDSERLDSEEKSMETPKVSYAGNLWCLETEERFLLCLQICSYQRAIVSWQQVRQDYQSHLSLGEVRHAKRERQMKTPTCRGQSYQFADLTCCLGKFVACWRL